MTDHVIDYLLSCCKLQNKHSCRPLTDSLKILPKLNIKTNKHNWFEKSKMSVAKINLFLRLDAIKQAKAKK